MKTGEHGKQTFYKTYLGDAFDDESRETNAAGLGDRNSIQFSDAGDVHTSRRPAETIGIVMQRHAAGYAADDNASLPKGRW